MEFEKMIELIKTVSDSNLTQFQIEEDGFKLSMKTDKQSKVVVQKQESVPKEIQSVAIADAEPAEQKEIKKAEGNVVKSPLVGTFYSASSPDSAPFVKVGDTVKKGQVLGIVEAMKLMNEIESEFDGVVKEIQIENEQVVEYGQPLFVIG
ncbi:acetyl-CoA carboxylase biotin carboxyl carrier protein [Blautia stercoris]|jgi:acetyl-CoA carboxylase biotin carboxyl carrier protein|nr:acetyl-CoA carboxylase biotin carboxyl carrier protein [Blautia stercoris]